MNFASPTFLFLVLPGVLAAYFLLPGLRVRNGLLLAASLVFYAWGEGFYLGLLLLSIGLNYGLGLWVGRLRERSGGRPVVALAVVANLAVLGAVKYAGFVVENVNAVLALLGAPPLALVPLHLPIGLSFFTLHALSYVLDVWRRKVPAEPNPLNVALYLALFPQLILGRTPRPSATFHSVPTVGVWKPHSIMPM
jgi:alginate O-acetyltransferase complex protein AlgI